jgi:PAS domain S-box-containing protein
MARTKCGAVTSRQRVGAVNGTLDDAGLSAQAALVASGHAFAVADAQSADWPLVWVNPAFEQLTGYPAADVVGRNCRLLQGPDTDRSSSARIRSALAAGQPITETLLNYRKDGSTWWNQVTITPVHDVSGAVTHFVGVQSDAGARVDASRQRDDAQAAADTARARLYAAEHATALALQRSLLPALPEVEGLQLAARYVPASDSAEIGGDWYDVLPLPDGSTGIAIGDVMGHDMGAAGAMGQLRSVLRSYAWEGHGPAGVLDRLNQLVCGLGMAKLATCVYARLEPRHGERPARLHWSNAGHPPPLLRTPDGSVHRLTEAAGMLIGVSTGPPAMPERPSASRDMPPGSVLLLYTDGLIEDHAHQDLDLGIDRLDAALIAWDSDTSLDDLAEQLAAAATFTTQDDDQCLLLLRVT